MKRQWQRYKELELISDELQSQSFTHIAPPQRTSWLRALWNTIDLALLRNLEPRVWQSTDPRSGQKCWHLYDPHTGKTYRLNSDAEVRRWLEQVFQQSS